MHSTLQDWAARWGVSQDALQDLRATLTADATPDIDRRGYGGRGAEADTLVRVRLEASTKGVLLWRNNVGACQDARTGRLIRYGLCNDSAKVSARYKSSDLIGIRPVVIAQHMVGLTIGQYVARELKAPGWVYSGTDRERAQSAYLTLVGSYGGDACYATNTGTL